MKFQTTYTFFLTYPIHLENAYPILDEEGKTLTPYSFTITNTCDLFASYTVNLEMLENTTLDSKYIRVMLNNEAIQNLNEFESTTMDCQHFFRQFL